MKKLLFFLILFLTYFNLFSQSFNFQKSWGTYFGDERFSLKDSNIDNNGNLYIVGFVVLANDLVHPIFNSSNVSQPIYGGGICDGFIAKFNPQGNLVWETFLGGDQSDVIGGIDIDQNNNIYVTGWTFSNNNIATLGAFQQTNAGQGDLMIAKYTPDGIKIWGTYYGSNQPETEYESSELPNTIADRIINNISHDQNNHFYISGVSYSSDLATTGSFQEVQGNATTIISKFSDAGTRMWTTYYGDNLLTRIRALDTSLLGVYAVGDMQDCVPPVYNTYFGTNNGLYPTRKSCQDSWLTKFDINGQRVWSTYFGGFGGADLTYKASVLFFDNKIYLAGTTSSDTYITTNGSFQENSNSLGTPYLVQFNDDGTRNWGTYLGKTLVGNSNNAFSNIVCDDNGGFFLNGVTGLSQNIATNGSYKSVVEGDNEGFISKFNANGEKIWGTYYGGEKYEFRQIVHPYLDKFYVVGMTSSTQQIASVGSLQPNIVMQDFANQDKINIFIAHFEPNTFSNNTFDQSNINIYPNPSNGNFTVAIKNGLNVHCKLELYDVVGKKIHQQNISTTETNINTTGLSKGIYLLKLTNPVGFVYNTKIIIE